MVVVYGNFANGGYRVKPYSIEKIETQRGKVIYQAKRTKITKVLDKDTAGIMTAMLRKVITMGTGRGANIGKPMGGKTGTTNENRDAWFIGYTPDIVTGVFMGNDDNTSLGLTGGTAPARIWKDMMIVATEKYGKPEFDYPAVDFTIDFVEVPYTPAVMMGAPIPTEMTQTEEQKGIRALLPFPSKKNDVEEFQSIPVQLNDNLLNGRQASNNEIQSKQIEADSETMTNE